MILILVLISESWLLISVTADESNDMLCFDGEAGKDGMVGCEEHGRIGEREFSKFHVSCTMGGTGSCISWTAFLSFSDGRIP